MLAAEYGVRINALVCFVAGGGGAWYTTTLGMLPPGDRVRGFIPSTGYVGVGEAQGAVTALDDWHRDCGWQRG